MNKPRLVCFSCASKLNKHGDSYLAGDGRARLAQSPQRANHAGSLLGWISGVARNKKTPGKGRETGGYYFQQSMSMITERRQQSSGSSLCCSELVRTGRSTNESEAASLPPPVLLFPFLLFCFFFFLFSGFSYTSPPSLRGSRTRRSRTSPDGRIPCQPSEATNRFTGLCSRNVFHVKQIHFSTTQKPAIQ